MNEFQRISFGILKDFDAFCKNNNIDYFIIGGTVLGAVRHQGFIPWDDDIDIGLLREDYNKLLKIIDKLPAPYIGEFPEFSRDFHLNFGKIYDSSTTVMTDTPFKQRRGVWIDVFPIDGVFKNKILRNIHFSLIFVVEKLISARRQLEHQCIKKKGWKKLILAFVGKSTRFLSLNSLTILMNFLLSIKSVEKSIYVGNLVGRWGRSKEVHLKKNILDFVFLPFEGSTFPAPSNPDEYLKKLYGNYMKLPPVDKRNSGHSFIEIDLKNSYLNKK